ncbi:hypothetical protein PMAYCL1PPCAC_21919, partial [Pristionchus mayeri]
RKKRRRREGCPPIRVSRVEWATHRNPPTAVDDAAALEEKEAARGERTIIVSLVASFPSIGEQIKEGREEKAPFHQSVAHSRGMHPILLLLQSSQLHSRRRKQPEEKRGEELRTSASLVVSFRSNGEQRREGRKEEEEDVLPFESRTSELFE